MSIPAQAKQLESARVALLAAKTDPDLAAPLAELSYTPAKIAEGWALYEDAAQAWVAVTQLRADQLQATREVRDLRRATRQAYASVVQVAKVIFSDSANRLTALAIPRPHKRGPKKHRRAAASEPAPEPAADAPADTNPVSDADSPAAEKPQRRRLSQADLDWVGRAEDLYTNALGIEEIQAALAEVGYSIERLQAEQAALEHFKQRAEERRIKTIETSAGYRMRREKLQALRAWRARFNGILTAAWHTRPDLLDKVGLKPRGRQKKS